MTLLFGEPRVEPVVQQMVQFLDAASESYRDSFSTKIRCFFFLQVQIGYSVGVRRKQPVTMRNASLMGLSMKGVWLLRHHAGSQHSAVK